MTSAAFPEPAPALVRARVAWRRFLGALLTLNFAVLWAGPIFVQGRLFHAGLRRVLRPIYFFLDRSEKLRRFAARHVYRKPVHVDYFARAILHLLGVATGLAVVFFWQIRFGALTWWLVAAYYFWWVGFGGRGMGSVYTFAHREGHVARGGMYRPWIRRSVGNIFENWVGLWHGIVPHTFSTSHILLHHRLDGGKSDPIYLWDLDRTRFGDMLLYQWRMFQDMAGTSSLAEFRRQSGAHPAIPRAHATLRRGMLVYHVVVPIAIIALLLATGSSATSAIAFWFFIYFQPLLGMSAFLAVVNWGQHGFLEHDGDGRLVDHVTNLTILEGEDNSFWEDHHLAHHVRPAAAHDEYEEVQSSEMAGWARSHGALFKDTSIVEIAVLMQLGQFDRLIDKYYVDCSGTVERDELVALFKRRAQRREMSYEDYEFRYRRRLGGVVRDRVAQGDFTSENRAYVFQAHHNVDHDLRVVEPRAS